MRSKTYIFVLLAAAVSFPWPDRLAAQEAGVMVETPDNRAADIELQESPALDWSFPGELDITGFGDVLIRPGAASGEDNGLGLGQAEVDIATGFKQKIAVTAAVAVDEGSKSVGTTQLTADFHLLGRDSGSLFNSGIVNSAGVVVGQFDVPFGLDWMVYPSIDRRTVSTPLAVEETHDCWNDYGAYGYIRNDRFNLTAFATDGAGTGGARTRYSTGGRLGLALGRHLELGSSRAAFFYNSDQAAATLWGLDIQARLGALEIKGEYLRRGPGPAAEDNLHSRGYYLQGLYDFGACYLFGRSESITSPDEGGPDIRRYVAGAGVVLPGGIRFKLEQQLGRGLVDQTVAQLVFGF